MILKIEMYLQMNCISAATDNILTNFDSTLVPSHTLIQYDHLQII